MKIHWKELILSLFICFLPALFGSLFMIGTIDSWYASLNKPWFTPPNWVFGPVWTALYLLIGISLYLIWISRTNTFRKTTALSFFGIQLVLNALWTPVFFSAQSIPFSLIIIFALDIIVIITLWRFYELEKRAGYLLIPYLTWLCIATLLNLSVFILN